MYTVLILKVKTPYLKFGIFENKYLVGAFILGTIMQVIVVAVPQIAEVFKLVPLNKEQWLYTIAISLVPLIIIEVQKKFEEIKFRKVIYQTANVKK